MFITLIVVAILAVIGVFIYNRLVSLRQGTKQAFSDIDVQLKARADLVPNLVSTVKAYAKHERETLDAVIAARNAAQRAGDMASAAQADGLMGAALGKLFAIAEAYPDLKANESFVHLQEELSDIENKIAAARRFLNSAVAEYNGAIEQFPAVLFAKGLGFKPDAMYEIPAEERAAASVPPSVSF